MKLKTWHYEFTIVIILLTTITYFVANNLNNWIATLAVCITFGYTQISDRLMERQQIMSKPDVDCYWKLNYYFWAKEFIWIILFVKLQSYAALGGCFIFGIYPFWRKYYRNKIKPIEPIIPYTTFTSRPFSELDLQQSIGRIERIDEIKPEIKIIEIK